MAKKVAQARKLNVTSVSFKSCIEIKPYQHAHVEMTATVAPGEDPSTVLDQLKVLVAAELKAAKEGRVPQPEVTGRFRT